jgi:hypothetical protein
MAPRRALVSLLLGLLLSACGQSSGPGDAGPTGDGGGPDEAPAGPTVKPPTMSQPGDPMRRSSTSVAGPGITAMKPPD